MNELKSDCNGCEYFIELERSLSFFLGISNEIMSKKPLDKLLNEIIDSSKTLLNAEACTLYLYEKENKSLYFHSVSGPKNINSKTNNIKLGEGIAGWVAKNKKPLQIDDCYADSRFNTDYDKISGFVTKNMLCVPMMKEKDLIGVIQLMNKKDFDSFSEIDMNFAKMLSSQCAVAIENARLLEIELRDEQLKIELNTARKIQQNILPKELPTFTDLDIEVKLIPAKEIGGDYYNIIKISDSKTLVFIVDVAGKSISAALIVSTIYSFLQTYLLLNKDLFDLKNFVNSLNQFLMTATTSDKFATAWFGLYDHSSKNLESINAGHNQTYLLKQNSVIELTKGGLFLGIVDLNYDSEIIQLEKNDSVIFYTDGVTEAMNEKEEEFGDDRFLDLLKNADSESSEIFLEKIISEVKNHRGNAEQSDDITCGVLRVL